MLLSLHRLAGVQQSINDALRENRLRRDAQTVAVEKAAAAAAKRS